MENSMEAMEVPTPGHVSGENHGLKGYRQVFIEALFSQDIGATWASIVRGMDKGDVVHIYNGILRSHEKEWTKATCSNMDGPRECHSERRKPGKEGEILHDVLYMWNLKTNDTNELIYKTGRDSQA